MEFLWLPIVLVIWVFEFLIDHWVPIVIVITGFLFLLSFAGASEARLRSDREVHSKIEHLEDKVENLERELNYTQGELRDIQRKLKPPDTSEWYSGSFLDPPPPRN